jgi:cell division septation protein DedD
VNPDLTLQPTPQQQAAAIDARAGSPGAANTVTRARGRAEDPLEGIRNPYQASQQQAAEQPALPPQQDLGAFAAQQQAALQPPPVTQQQSPPSIQSFPQPPAAQAPQTSSSGAGGYVVQLAAYRSESEAMQQFQQLRARHQNLIGNLPPSVQQTNLGASGTFYRLGMGPVQSKQIATELCNKLISAGERDCLVRRR